MSYASLYNNTTKHLLNIGEKNKIINSMLYRDIRLNKKHLLK